VSGGGDRRVYNRADGGDGGSPGSPLWEFGEIGFENNVCGIVQEWVKRHVQAKRQRLREEEVEIDAVKGIRESITGNRIHGTPRGSGNKGLAKTRGLPANLFFVAI
jgi:hypothetical protein